MIKALLVGGADPAVPPSVGQFVDLSMAGDHACALGSDGSIACWGDNTFGQSTPPPAPHFIQVAVGEGFSCGLEDSGLLQCWGDTALHQAEAPYGSFVGLSAASDHACGLRLGLQVTCWGQNSNGEAPQFTYQPISETEIPALVYWEHHFLPREG